MFNSGRNYGNNEFKDPNIFRKLKDNTKSARDVMDYYDYYVDDYNPDWNRYDENYELHAGRWPNIENMNASSVSFEMGSENIILGGGKLRHWPILNRATEHLVSEVILRPFIPIIRDYSSRARNYRERKRLQAVVQHLQDKYVKPKLQQITSQVMGNISQDQIASMPIEQQQQIQSDIQRQVIESSPEELLENLQSIHTPDERLFKQLLEGAMQEVSLKDKFDIGGEHAIVTAEEYYRILVKRNEPIVDVLKPRYLTWASSDREVCVEKGEFARYVEYLTFQDVIGESGLDLNIRSLKDLIDWHSGIPGNHEYNEVKNIDHEVSRFLADNPQIEDSIRDVRTLEGQQDIRHLYKFAGHLRRHGYGIKKTYITWRWARPVRLVTRLINGVPETFLRDDHYRLDKSKGDIKVQKRFIEQTWHGTKYGNTNQVYVDVEALPYQYTSINDVSKPNLSIYGRRYNVVHNEVKNRSFVDLAKPWQYRYNVIMKRKEEIEATDVGKVIFGTMNLKPANISWKQWFKSIYVGKFGLLSTHFEGLNQMDKKPIHVEDLSNIRDIQAFIQQLEYAEEKIYSSMGFNPAKFGQLGQYTNTATARATMEGADKQLVKFHDTHRQIKQSVTRGLLSATLYAYKDNEHKKDILLDDFTRAHFEKNFDNLNAGEYEVAIVDDFQESQKLEQMRQLALTMIQNGGSAKDMASVINANSMGEIEDILAKSDKKRQEQEKKQFQRQKQLLQQEEQKEMNIMKLKMEFEALQKERDREAKLAMAELNAQTMERSNDINENMVNDSLEKAMVELASKERQLDKELSHKEKIEKLKLTKSDSFQT